MFSKLSISQRLWLMSGLAFLIFIVSTFIGWQALNSGRHILEQLQTASQVHLLNLNRMATGMRDNYAQILLAFQHAPENPTAHIHDHPTDMHLEIIATRKKELDAAWEKIVSSKIEDDEKALAQDIEDKRKAWLARLEAAQTAIRAGDFSAETQAAFLKAGREEGKAMLEAIDRMVEFQADEARKASEEEEVLYQRDLAVFGVLIIVGIVGVLGTAWFTIQRIKTSLAAAGAAAEAIAQGDLTQTVPRLGQDEIGLLLARLGAMRDNLNTLVRSIRDNVQALNQSAAELAGAAHGSARTTEMQAEAASGMAASVEELSVSIDQVEEHAREARNVTEASSTQSSEGGRIIHEAAQEMKRIAEAVNGTAGTIRDLEGYSDQISSIVQVIKDIADQTNLLALNAAIEAARAGEQGRGFAVVADEVRKLAERTGNSTQEISAMIGKIQQGTQKAVQEMEAGVARVNEGVGLANRAGDSVTGIRQSSDQVTRAVDDINLALKEQAVAARDIAQKVERIAQGSEENSASVAQTAASAKRLEQLAGELNQLAGRFRVA
ncbi:MAG: methyl-accepting chemotaxis protein [Pseudomonadota bacterium]